MTTTNNSPIPLPYAEEITDWDNYDNRGLCRYVRCPATGTPVQVNRFSSTVAP
jgi:hypothetical protein